MSLQNKIYCRISFQKSFILNFCQEENDCSVLLNVAQETETQMQNSIMGQWATSNGEKKQERKIIDHQVFQISSHRDVNGPKTPFLCLQSLQRFYWRLYLQHKQAFTEISEIDFLPFTALEGKCIIHSIWVSQIFSLTAWINDTDRCFATS